MIAPVPALDDLPVRYVRRACAASPGFVLVKAGLRIRADGQPRPLLGFGCATDPATATARARAELYERLIPASALARDAEVEVPGLRLDGHEGGHRIAELIAPPGTGSDATGFAFHPDLGRARSHAARELTERHLLAELWYGGLGLVPLDPPPGPDAFTGPGPRARHYTVAARTPEPFVLVVVHDPAREVLVVGSAVRDTREAAAAHAVEEAVMMYDTVLHDSVSAYVGAGSTDRLRSLRGPLAARRAAHLESRVRTPDEGDPAPLRVELPADTWLSTICHHRDGHLVRAWSPDLTLPRGHRPAGPGQVPDPFC
ncbi:YcaO-like family protein [Kitasatospora phosalacinea]|uniref:YcaO-like family protein n=1 Tax=Kitasatospora phosalacinea TaxID=2065 RepID=A0ABW6GMR7_9ACTN